MPEPPGRFVDGESSAIQVDRNTDTVTISARKMMGIIESNRHKLIEESDGYMYYIGDGDDGDEPFEGITRGAFGLVTDHEMFDVVDPYLPNNDSDDDGTYA